MTADSPASLSHWEGKTVPLYYMGRALMENRSDPAAVAHITLASRTVEREAALPMVGRHTGRRQSLPGVALLTGGAGARMCAV
jgi:hypothetical protein